jgi:uncharacterized membrane protein YphA (DoxX/SURF4 family)
MKVIRLICRIIAGLVFIFSGFVKAIDPLGSAYKFHDYFVAFHIDFLQVFTLPLAILMCTLEFIAGFSVLSGFRQKTGIWIIFLLILFFTPLTLVLAITNPVSDCGCFGDAIHLTNWQTFGKNIFLLVLILILFTERKKVTGIFKAATEWSIIGSVSVFFILFSVFNLRYLPIVDFLPYSIGTNISAKMQIPEGAQSEQYSTTFIYERDGVRKEFTLNDYPANDTSWKFIDQKSVLIRKGYKPPIHDFSVINLKNENITGKILNDSGYMLLMVSKKLSQSNQEKLSKGYDLGIYCISNGIGFYILTASATSEVKSIDNGLSFCLTDETVLKTMIRSNPGYILLRNGTIIGKWSWANVPEKEWFSNDITGKQLEHLIKRNSGYLVIISFISLGVFLMLLCKLPGEKENTNIYPNI